MARNDRPRFDLEYQTRRHLESHMRQWPHADRQEEEARIREALLSGNAWLWPEPWNMKQMNLFDESGGRNAKR